MARKGLQGMGRQSRNRLLLLGGLVPAAALAAPEFRGTEGLWCQGSQGRGELCAVVMLGLLGPPILCRLEPPCARRQNLTAPYCSQLGHAPGMTCQAGPVDRTLPAERFLKPLKQVVQAALNGHFLETAFTVFASHESFLDVRIVLWELNCLGP